MDPNDPQQPDRPSGDQAETPAADAAQPAYERFVNGQEALNEALPQEPLGEPARQSRRSAWLAMGAVAVALGLLWLAPGQHDEPAPASVQLQTGAGGEAPLDDEDAGGLAAGQPAPLDFTMKDMNGVDVKLASFKGKVILLNFWATWCGPCREEIPALVELQKAYADQVVVLGVSIDDPVDKLKKYATDMHVNYPVLVGKDRQDMQDAYGPLWGIPVSVFIGRDGKVWKRHPGAARKEMFEREIKALIQPET
jgi:thiol-disulfide isomerase/thioredoxin